MHLVSLTTEAKVIYMPAVPALHGHQAAKRPNAYRRAVARQTSLDPRGQGQVNCFACPIRSDHRASEVSVENCCQSVCHRAFPLGRSFGCHLHPLISSLTAAQREVKTTVVSRRQPTLPTSGVRLLTSTSTVGTVRSWAAGMRGRRLSARCRSRNFVRAMRVQGRLNRPTAVTG